MNQPVRLSLPIQLSEKDRTCPLCKGPCHIYFGPMTVGKLPIRQCTYCQMVERFEPEILKAKVVIAENGTDGMVCKSCNIFCAYTEPNEGTEYRCPDCR